MNDRGRASVTACLCAGMLVLVAACGGGATPAVSPSYDVTPETTASSLETPFDSPAPSEQATGEATPTPSPTPAGAPTASTVPTRDTRPGAVCSGSAENVPFWTQAASWLTFDVYCAVLPKGWYLSAATYDSHNGGILNAAYAGPGGASIQIKEGKFCTTSADACSQHDAVLGTARFGDRPGPLYSLAGGGFAIYIDPGRAPAWQIVGRKMNEALFVSLAGALARVPKS